MLESLGQWTSALAAALYGAMAIWQARRDGTSLAGRALVAALALTALSAYAAALTDGNAMLISITIHARDLGWLVFMYFIWLQGNGREQPRTLRWIYWIIALIIMATATIDLQNAAYTVPAEPAFLAVMLLQMMCMVGLLVLVHNLYTAAFSEARDALRLPLVGLAAIWVYDLNLFTLAYLGRMWEVELVALRSIVLVLVAPAFALATMRNHDWSLRLSRTMAFQSISLGAIGTYLALMILVTSALEMLGGPIAKVAQISFVFGALLAALILMPSKAFRSWFHVKIAKHLFQHRYDYRVEWLRFTQTLSQTDDIAQPLPTRAIKALADITEAPGGCLLVPGDAQDLIGLANWNWDGRDMIPSSGSAAFGAYLERTGRIVELDALRRGEGLDDEIKLIPQWLLDEPDAWVIVPLVHVTRLAGVVVLTRPALFRSLDWEDLDLLRVAGRQVASYLAEARSQEALSDAKRFDEFNRRFAFIMHDIKNLVSQLSLVTRNAERHAGNPDFQADMIETLKSSTARMNSLLARLSQHNKARVAEPGPLPLFGFVQRLAAARCGQHPVMVTGDQSIIAVADPARLDQALGHLVQNAIEASPAHEPVTIHLDRAGHEARIAVIDQGTGMSPAFLNQQLFKPFSSTKPAGFGIGSFEARTIITEMRGRIEVESHQGKGSRFMIILPMANSQFGSHPYPAESKAA